MLMKKGAKLDLFSSIGASPAVAARTIDMAEYLVSEGASPAGAHIFLFRRTIHEHWSLMAIDLLAR